MTTGGVTVRERLRKPPPWRSISVDRLVTLGAMAILLAITAVGFPVSARGQEAAAPDDAPFMITAEPQFAGHFKLGSWLPIIVTVANQGVDTAVEVRATVGLSGGPTTYVVPVELPAGSRKTVMVYTLPESLPRTFDVLAVQTRGGDAVASTTVRVSPSFPSDTLCGVAGYPPGALTTLDRLRRPGPYGETSSVTVAPVNVAHFPDLHAGLSSLDCLILGAGDGGTITLSTESQAALTGWVRAGGHVIVVTGERWQTTFASLPDELKPAKVTGTRAVSSLTGLSDVPGVQDLDADLVIADLTPNVERSARVRAGADSPLIVEMAVGAGRVTAIAFDPEARAVLDSGDALTLWGAILGPVDDELFFGQVNPRLMESAPIVSALGRVPELALPSISLLMALLGAYVLVVSPINYLVLRRLNRLSWAWATTLVCVAIFAIGAYGLGVWIRGDQVVVNRITITDADYTTGNDQPALTGRAYLALFSPSQSTYQLSIGDEDRVAAGGGVLISPMSPLTDPWSPRAASAAPGGTIVQGQPAIARDVGVGQWASRFLLAEYAPRDAPPIIADLAIDGDHLVGSVKNTGDVPLTGVAAYIGAHVMMIGDLEPGEEMAVRLPLQVNAAMNPRDFGMPLNVLLLGVQPGGPWPDERASGFEVRRLVLESIFGWGPAGVNQPEGIHLVAWSTAPGLAVEVDGNAVKTHDTQVYSLHLPVRVVSTTVEVPIGMLSPRLVAQDATSVSITPYDIQVVNGTADFEFTLPAALQPMSLDTLSIHMPDWGGVGPGVGGRPIVSLYDWNSGEWEGLEGRTVLTASDPERFLHPERGVIWVRLASSGPDFPVYTLLDVSLSGVTSSQVNQDAATLRQAVMDRW